MLHVVIIPALEPDERLTTLVEELVARGLTRIIVVDDGSETQRAAAVFAQCEPAATVIRHESNLGKGAAIKTGIRTLNRLYPDAKAFVTVDADGQHAPEDVLNVCRQFDEKPYGVVIGARDLKASEVPLRSRIGNAFSSAYFKLDTGRTCHDTQTGLRCVPTTLAPLALRTPGERYEYEMNFLTTIAREGVALQCVPIQTVYIDGNEGSHFRPVQDSLRIFRTFFRFAGASLVCSVVDLGLFALLVSLLDLRIAALVALATAVARCTSGLLNFMLNRSWSFKAGGRAAPQALRYATLFIGQMLASMTLVTLLSFLPVPLVVVKALVDSVLFVVSYFVQRNWVFRKRTGEEVVRNASRKRITGVEG